MLLRILRYLRHGPLRGMGPVWVELGKGYRHLVSGFDLSVNQRIGPYGPFRLDAHFAFSNFEEWGEGSNDGFVACVEACRGHHCVMDIGAHIGLVTLPIASVMDSDGTLVCFEPSTANRHFLERHLKLNGFTNLVRTESMFVGSESKENILFHEMETVSYMNSLVSRGSEYRSVTRRQTSLDDYCEEKELSPEVIKIDVEGAEISVLQGARKTLSRCRPLIILSVHPWHLGQIGCSCNELRQLIDDLDYECMQSDGKPVHRFATREYILTPKNN